MATTFPYTPSFVHASVTGYAVIVNKFEDQSEQRYLTSRQQGLELTYEWPHVDSALAAQITSFFVGQVGPAGRFFLTDHRDGTSYLARFRDTTLEQTRGPHVIRGLRIPFTVVDSTIYTTPVATAFTRPAPPDCFHLVYSGTQPVNTPTLPGDPSAPASGTIVGSGNSVQADSGADIFFWRQSSFNQTFQPYYISNQFKQFTTFGTDNLSLNRLYATPLIVSRSGAVVGELGVFITQAGGAGAQLRLGIYEARSSATVNLYPGSLVVDAGAVPVDAVGLQSVTTSAQLQADRFYYTVAIASSAPLASYRGITETDAVMLGINSAFTNLREWVTSLSAASALPSTFPNTTATDANHAPAILVRFKG